MTKPAKRPCKVCGKELPEGHIESGICSEECMKRTFEMKNEGANRKLNLAIEDSLWLGQARRKRAMDAVMKLAKEECPMPCNKFACLVSFRTGLSLRKITDDYLEVLLEIGLLKRNDNIMTLGEAGTV